MKSSDYALLGQLITAANNWRTAATSAGGDLEQVNVRFPDDSAVVLRWDHEANVWQIDT